MQSSTPASSSKSPQTSKRDQSPRSTSDYIRVKRTLGQGQNATVFLIEYNTDPEPRAVSHPARSASKLQL
jgi:hypothetical protein